MRTLVKTLLVICGLLGVELDGSMQQAAPAEPPEGAQYAAAEGLALVVRDDRVVLHVESRLLSKRLLLSAVAPGVEAGLGSDCPAASAPPSAAHAASASHP